MSTVAQILGPLQALPKARHVGGGRWRACCPAHKDSNPSLSWTLGDDGRVLVKCHAGCSIESILAALSLPLADLFAPKTNGAVGSPRPAKPKAGPRAIERRFRVFDVAGAAWEQVRPEDQHGRKTRDPWWEPRGSKLEELLPYGSQLVEDWPRTDPIIVVEGPNVAESLNASGFRAVATFGVSYRPVPAALACLAGRDVILWPDADKPGHDHMRDMARRLADAESLRWVEPPADAFSGWDAANADEATVRRLIQAAGPVPAVGVRLTPASSIKVRPVHWLWDGRLALGTLALLGGREGIGKTTAAYTIAADITRGRLAGVYAGRPKAVIVAATEDAWAETIVPRLMAAGADLERVFRVDVVDVNGIESELSLPRDLAELERQVGAVDAAMILLDPLMSRLDGKLDTHKDAEVRLALEPLVAIAGRTRTTVLGIIHVNKGGSVDPLSMLMGSRAFAAVARAVLFMMTDPEDATIRLLGQPKNNLGPIDDLPTLSLRIEAAHVADTDEGPVTSGRIVWIGESNISIADALSDREQAASRTKTARLADAMRAIVEANGGEIPASDGYQALEPEWSDDLASEDLKTRARKRAGIRTENRDGVYWWSIRGTHPPTTHRGPVTPVTPVTGPVTHPPDPPVNTTPPGNPVGGYAGMSVADEMELIFAPEEGTA